MNFNLLLNSKYQSFVQLNQEFSFICVIKLAFQSNNNNVSISCLNVKVAGKVCK